eukprot:3941980-Rhodomonas_salina.1
MWMHVTRTELDHGAVMPGLMRPAGTESAAYSARPPEIQHKKMQSWYKLHWRCIFLCLTSGWTGSGIIAFKLSIIPGSSLAQHACGV